MQLKKKLDASFPSSDVVPSPSDAESGGERESEDKEPEPVGEDLVNTAVKPKADDGRGEGDDGEAEAPDESLAREEKERRKQVSYKLSDRLGVEG